MTKIDKINNNRFNFPMWKLQEKGTWVTIHRKVCTTCALKILAERDLYAEPDCLAMDKNGILCHSTDNPPTDYAIYDYNSGQFKSIKDCEIECSICNNIIK